MFGQMAPMGTGAFDVALDMEAAAFSLLASNGGEESANFPYRGFGQVPITLVRCHLQLLATARVHRTCARRHRLTFPSHHSLVRRRHSALPHTSRHHSTIVVVPQRPRHTLRLLQPLIYHYLVINRLVCCTRRHHRLSHQLPHAIHHNCRLSLRPFALMVPSTSSPLPPSVTQHLVASPSCDASLRRGTRL